MAASRDSFGSLGGFFVERKMTIELRSSDEVQEFVREVMLLKEEMDLRSGRYVINAKSILGIYSLNLSKPLELVVHDDCGGELAVLDKYRIRV